MSELDRNEGSTEEGRLVEVLKEPKPEGLGMKLGEHQFEGSKVFNNNPRSVRAALQ